MTIDMSGMKGDMGETAGEGTSAEMECPNHGGKLSLQPVQRDLRDCLSGGSSDGGDFRGRAGGHPAAEEVDTEEVSEAGEDELVSEAGQMVESAAGSLAEELGVKGIQETTDTSVTFTDKGSQGKIPQSHETGIGKGLPLQCDL